MVVQQLGKFYQINDGKVEEIDNIVEYITFLKNDSLRTIQCGIFNIEGMNPDGTAGS